MPPVTIVRVKFQLTLSFEPCGLSPMLPPLGHTLPTIVGQTLRVDAFVGSPLAEK